MQKERPVRESRMTQSGTGRELAIDVHVALERLLCFGYDGADLLVTLGTKSWIIRLALPRHHCLSDQVACRQQRASRYHWDARIPTSSASVLEKFPLKRRLEEAVSESLIRKRAIDSVSSGLHGRPENQSLIGCSESSANSFIPVEW